MDATDAGEKPLRHKERLSRKKLVKWFAIAALLIVAIVFAYRYWRHSQLYVITDNAYLNANTVEIAIQVNDITAWWKASAAAPGPHSRCCRHRMRPATG